jgi:hypothetical protein
MRLTSTCTLIRQSGGQRFWLQPRKRTSESRKLGVLVQFYEGIGRELNYSGEFGLLARLKNMVRP